MADPRLVQLDDHDVLTWQIGDVRVQRVVESVLILSPRFLLPDLSQELLDSCGAWVAPFFTGDGKMRLSIHSFVVESDGTTIVVDTCIADHSERILPGTGEFAERLATSIDGGLEAVDVVVCTHLHFDHVGWNTRLVDGSWAPTFPNARYLVSTPELAAARSDDAGDVLASSVTPLDEHGLLDAVEPDHRIDTNVRLLPTPGHSPGHVSVMIESLGRRALITGDAFHTPVQIAHPKVSATVADSDSDIASATRRRLIAQLVDTPTLVLGTHFATPTAGRIRSGDLGAWLDTSPRPSAT